MIEQDKKLAKLLERQETLSRKKEKIEEELKKVTKQIKEIEHEQKIKNIEDTIIVIDDRGIDIRDIIKEIQKGTFDYLRKAEQKNETVADLEVAATLMVRDESVE